MKKLLTIMTIMIISLIGITSVKAQEINYNFKQYRVQYYNLGNGTSAWTSYVNFNTATNISNGYGVSGIAVKFGYSSKFQAGTKYRVIIDIAWQPQDAVDYTAKNVDHTNCLGTLTTNNWSADASRIESCDYIGYSPVPNSTRIKYVYDIVPAVTVEGIQFNVYYNGTAEVSYINVKTTSSITTGEDISGAINEQTIVLSEEIQQIGIDITTVIEESIGDIMDATHEYEEEDITDQVEDLHDAEQSIHQNVQIDNLIQIGLDTNARTFIWETIGALVIYNYWFGAILFGLLSIGVCKLILNR